MHNHISKTKLFFTLGVLLLAFSIVFGSLYFRGNYRISFTTLQQDWQTIKYKVKYAQLSSDNGMLLASLGGLFNNPKSNANENVANADMSAPAIPVLLYHGILNSPGRFNMTPSVFSDEMFALKRAGYTTITLADFEAYMRGEKTLPEKSILITFDDARLDSFLGADPVLKALGYNAVMFVPTSDVLNEGNIGTSYYLNASQLKDLLKTGRWEIGSHAMQQTGDSVPINSSGTNGNFLSNKMWLIPEGRLESDDEYQARIAKELSQSKDDLERTYGLTIDAFAYPSSDYGQQSVNNPGAASVISEEVQKNYNFAFQQVWPNDDQYTYNYPGSDPYHLHRIEPAGDWSGAYLISYLAQSQPKSLPYTDLLSTSSGWKTIWGKTNIGNGSLLLTTSDQKSGSAVFLDGTKQWKNYQYGADMAWRDGDTVTLFANYTDENNNLACTFGTNFVRATETIGGVSHDLAQDKIVINLPQDSVRLGIGVSGTDVACFYNRKNVLITAHSGVLSSGGIGIKIWSQELKDREVAVTGLDVMPYTVSEAEAEKIIATKSAGITAQPQPKLTTSSTTIHTASTLNLVQSEQEVLTEVSPIVSPVDETTVEQAVNRVGWSSPRSSETMMKNLLSKIDANSFWIAKTTDAANTISSDSSGDYQASITLEQYHGNNAYLYFNPISVQPNTDYLYTVNYTANVNASLVADFELTNGTYQEMTLMYLLPVSTPTKTQVVIHTPDNVKTMTVMHIIANKGTMSVAAPALAALGNGAFNAPYISINFDDGYATSYTTALPILKKYGYTADHFIITHYIGTPLYMTRTELSSLQQKGQEIDAHSQTHKNLRLLVAAAAQKEIGGSRADLAAIGIKSTVFNYPYGAFNNYLRALVASAGFNGARTILRGYNTRFSDPYLLRDYRVGANSSLPQAQAYIDSVAAHQGWGILEFHDITESGGTSDNVTPEVLDTLLKYIHDKHIAVISMQDGLNKLAIYANDQ